ncbi:MAG TPA: helix-turn-helix domain-containing protein [Candidatus Limnocylindrales bacterium]|nr:helix-turn-helix domain-containing protein [Candidatus Limnocylindrales bacterium]
MSPADETPLQPGFMPQPVMLISSAETLRAISDPTRMRLMEVMVQRQDPAWSVKELAAALEVPTTRLYHHIEQLLSHGIVMPVERRIVSGIIETRYRVAALSFQLDRRLFEGDADAATQAIHDTLVTIFDTARDEIEAAMRSAATNPPGDHGDSGDPERDRVLVARSLARLTPARAAEYRRRLGELQEEFADEDAPEAEAWGVVLAVYPMPPTAKEPSDG